MLESFEGAQRKFEKEWPTVLEEEREELVHALNRDLLAEEALDPVFEVVRIRDAQILHDLP